MVLIQSLTILQSVFPLQWLVVAQSPLTVATLLESTHTALVPLLRKTTNAKTVALVGINPSTVLPIPYTDMIKDILCAILAAFAFVAIWILAAII